MKFINGSLFIKKMLGFYLNNFTLILNLEDYSDILYIFYCIYNSFPI